MNVSDVSAARAAAVAGTIERIREIEREQGVTRAALAAIEAEMKKLAGNSSFFRARNSPRRRPAKKAAAAICSRKIRITGSRCT